MFPMARIRTKRVWGNTRVTVSGRLSAADMGRLERACGEALTHNPLQLHLDLTRVTHIDGTAQAVIERLRHRGAQVRRDRDGHGSESERAAIAGASGAERTN